MNRSRIRDEMMVHWAVPVALNLAYQSEGLGPWGLRVVFKYVNMVFRYSEISGYAGIPRAEG